MEIFKYTTFEDIDEFLKTLGYNWTGLVKTKDIIGVPMEQDFEYTIELNIKDEIDNFKFLCISVTDSSFFIEDKTLNKKFNFQDYSLQWRTFMINRKDKEYSKYIYSIIKEEKNKLIKKYKIELNLIRKRTEQLKYEKQKEMAQFNTTLLNIETKLSKFEIKQLNKKLQQNNSNTTTEQ